MKLFFLLLLLCHFSGHTQISYDRASHEKKKFSKRNKSIEVRYKGQSGKNGRNDFLLFNFLQLSRGTNGWSGGEGPCLEVNVSGIPSGDSAILYILITGGEEPAHYFVNPRMGKITIYSDGGTGGEGGTRNDGTDRRGFDGGNGGMGGVINITFDPTALPYVDCGCIVGINRGGLGGSGGVSGMMGASGPPVYIKDVNGQVLKLVTDLKY